MNRLWTAILIVIVVLFTAGAAQAMGHGAPSTEPSLFGAMLWEFEHFLAHASMASQALAVLPTAPKLGWAMLNDQTLCASITPLTSMLFGSAWAALATFATLTLTVDLSLLWLAFKVRTILLALSWRWIVSAPAVA